MTTTIKFADYAELTAFAQTCERYARSFAPNDLEGFYLSTARSLEPNDGLEYTPLTRLILGAVVRAVETNPALSNILRQISPGC